LKTVSAKAFWITTILLILILVLGVGGSWYYLDIQHRVQLAKKDDKITELKDAASQDNEPTPNSAPGQYRYELIDIGTAPDLDQYLIKIDKVTEIGKVVVQSIHDAVPSLDSHILRTFAAPTDSELIFFRSILPNSDSPDGSIYSYSTTDNTFKKLAVNSIYHGSTGGFAKYIDDTKFAYIPNIGNDVGNNQELYLIDLLTDTSKKVVTLSGNETFNAGKAALSYCFDLSWSDSSNVKYAVFDQSKKTDLDVCPADVSTIDYFLAHKTISLN
jgi:hypothetical protein